MTPSTPVPKLPGASAYKARSRFILELFIILCLSVCYYFLVRNFALGVGNNKTNRWVFTACSQSTYHLDELYEWWKGRLAGMLLSGSLFDLFVRGDGYQIEQYAMLFGLYQAFWLLVLMLTMLVAVRESLLVNLCIFAGLIHNFACRRAGFYFYPWDLPATVFLTLAVLLHERGHRVLMLAAICVGCFFKETVLVGVVLCLFNRGWKWHWRLLGFAGPLTFYFLGKHWLIRRLSFEDGRDGDERFVQFGAVAAPGFFCSEPQADIFRYHTAGIFCEWGYAGGGAGGGLGKAVPALPVHDCGVCGWALCAGPTLDIWQGMFSEVRILTQVLPVSCLILSEYGQSWIRRSKDAAVRPQPGSSPEPTRPQWKAVAMKASKPIAGKNVAVREESAWACRKSDRGLILVAVVVMVISSIVVALGLLCAVGEPPT